MPRGTNGPAFQIGKRGFVWRHHAGARAAFNRHVADRHAAFHGEAANRLAAEFDHMAVAAGDADLADDGQNDVLGGDARGAAAVNLHQHGFGFELRQALRGQHVLNLAGANAESQRAQTSVRGGVAVAANNGEAGLRDAQFRPDDVHDALVGALHVEKQDPIFAAVAHQGVHLRGGHIIRQWADGGSWWARSGP